MKIDTAKPGDVYEIEGVDEVRQERKMSRFTIIEIGWYPSVVSAGVFFHGATVAVEGYPDKSIVDFMTLEFARKVENTSVVQL